MEFVRSFSDGMISIIERSIRGARPSSSAHQLLVLFALCALAVSCRKEEDDAPPPLPAASTFTLSVAHHVDGAPLGFDTMVYDNEAGYAYSISRVQYYLSRIVLLGTSATANDTLPGPFYIDVAGTNEFDLGALPVGTYSGALLLVGLPPEWNMTGGLPNTLQNLNMAWPDPMGGGYHFLKVEGHFMDGSAVTGFALHLGTNACLPVAVVDQPFTIGAAPGTLTLRFNVNELFRTPHTYDLSDGNYIMGDTVLMTRVAENAADAFTLDLLP